MRSLVQNIIPVRIQSNLDLYLISCYFLGFNNEKNVSASCQKKIKSARLSRKNEYKGGKAHSEEKDG